MPHASLLGIIRQSERALPLALTFNETALVHAAVLVAFFSSAVWCTLMPGALEVESIPRRILDPAIPMALSVLELA